MKESLRARCELFIENRDVIRESFTWQSSYLYPLCSSILTSKKSKSRYRKIKGVANDYYIVKQEFFLIFVEYQNRQL